MMARIAGAFMTSHILMGDKASDPQAGRVVDGLQEIGRRVRACRPDFIVVISSDHMFNLTLKLQPPFTVGISDSFTPFGDMDIPRIARPGNRAAAMAFCRAAAIAGYDLAQAEEYRPDHGVALPLMFMDPSNAIPIVPLLVNINMDPPPAPGRCLGLAHVLRETLQALPADQTVVVIGTGGLSHWINIPGHGEVNAEFDRQVMDTLESGAPERLAALTVEAILSAGGNGGLEIVNWMMAAAMLPGVGAEAIYYEPMPQWMTGMGGMAITA
jgi:2'-aminobiphenyl-2,3-diol 1,2-dioxygenase large subunit